MDGTSVDLKAKDAKKSAYATSRDMNLYEVIFNDPYGKTDGDEDTIYLVSALDFESAVDEVWRNASIEQSWRRAFFPLAGVVHEVGVSESRYADQVGTRIVRGPYIECAYNCGWRSWQRKIDGSEKTKEWEETPYVVA